MKEIAGEVRDIASSLLEAGDAAKTATQDFDAFGAARLQPASLAAKPPAISEIGGAGGAGVATGGKAGGRGFQQASRGVTQLTRAAGLLGGEAGEVAGEVAGVTTQFSGLLAGAQGLKGGIGSLVSSIGVAGAIGGAVAIAAVAALSFGINELSKASREAKAQMEDEIKAIRQRNDMLELTTDEILTRQAEIEQERIGLSRDLIDLQELQNKALAEEADERKNFLGLGETIGGGLFDLADGLGLVGGASETAQDAIDETTESMDELGEEATGLTEALNSAEVAANDAREALLAEADLAGELTAFRQQALEADSEGLAELRKNLVKAKEIRQAELATLQRSGDTSKEVTDRIDELNTELANLDQKTAILTEKEVLLSAQRKEAAAEAEELTTELEKDREKIVKLETDSRKKLVKASQELALAETEASQELVESRKEAQRQVQELIDKQQEANLIAEQEHIDNLNRIREEGNDEADKMANDFHFLEAARRRQEIADDQRKEEAAFDKRSDAQSKADDQDLIALRKKLVEEQQLKKQESEQDLERQRQELQQADFAAKAELEAARRAADDKVRALSKLAQREVRLATGVGEAQIQILEQVSSVAQQVAQSVSGLFSGLGGGIGGSSSLTNIFQMSGLGQLQQGTLNQSGLNATQQQMVAQMIKMGQKL
jgi:hypothetical protein